MDQSGDPKPCVLFTLIEQLKEGKKELGIGPKITEYAEIYILV